MLVATVLVACLSQCPVEVDFSPTTPGGLSGTSVAIDGDLAVFGAPLATGNGWASGMAIVYRNIDNIWVREAELIADDGEVGDMMGVSVAISGTRVIAGAWFNNHAGTNSGAAYIFEQVEGQWAQTTKLIADDASAQDSFGRRVAIDGDVCVVTAPLDDDNGSSSGSAYVFQFDETWFQLQKLTAKSGADSDQFGLGLAMDGERLVVGAPWANDGQGRAHVFDRADVMFFETAVLADPNGASMDNFSFGMDVDGDLIAIGSYLDDDVAQDAGSLFLFQMAPTGWSLFQHIEPNGVSLIDDQFSVSVAIDNSVMLVGNRFADVDGLPAGSVTVFDLAGSVWQQRSAIVSPEPTFEAEFGWSVAIDGDRGVVGGPWLEPDGEVRFYEGFMDTCGCIGDLNGDGTVGVSDVLQIIGMWGECQGCDEDLDENGFVDVSDLLQLISAWGNCS